MARRRVYKDPGPSAPSGFFSNYEYDAVVTLIKTLRSRVTQTKQTTLTHDDLLTMFVRPELREPAVLAVREFSTDRGDGIHFELPDPTDLESAGVVTVQFNPQWGDNAGFAYPKDVGTKYFGTRDQLDVVNKWLRWRLERGREWGLVLDVFKRLHQGSDLGVRRAADYNFHWPVIATLLELAGHRPAADKIRRAPLPKEVSALGPGLKQACTATMLTITKALILPQDAPELPDVHLKVVLKYPTAFRPWTENGMTFGDHGASKHITPL